MLYFILGFQKCFTSSVHDVFINDLNFKPLDKKNKESGYFFYKSQLDIDPNRNYVDGTVNYIYDKRAYANINQIDKKKILIFSRNPQDRYESMFKMFAEKFNYKISLKESIKEIMISSDDADLKDKKIFLLNKYSVNNQSNTLINQLVLSNQLNLIDSELAAKKLDYIKKGLINDFAKIEFNQYKKKEFHNTLNVLPLCFDDWMIRSIFENISIGYLNYFYADCPENLSLKLLKFLQSDGFNINTLKLPYKSPNMDLRKKLIIERLDNKEVIFLLNRSLNVMKSLTDLDEVILKRSIFFNS